MHSYSLMAHGHEQKELMIGSTLWMNDFALLLFALIDQHHGSGICISLLVTRLRIENEMCYAASISSRLLISTTTS